MKHRKCWISNSSSSSFICVGVKLDQKQIEKMFGEDDPLDKFLEYFDAGDTIVDGFYDDNTSSYYIGNVLCDSYEVLENGECSLEDLNKGIPELTSLLKEKGITEPVKLYYGERAS